MAGVGRSSRGAGKRGVASSSSASPSASVCVYYATTGVLVALCVAGAYFLTSTLSASLAGSDGDKCTITAYRHTKRSSFAYEVGRKKAVPSLPREVDDAARGKGSDEEGAKEEHNTASTTALDDPHARPDLDEHVSDREPKSAAVAMDSQRSEEADHVAARETSADEEEAKDSAVTSADKEQEAPENERDHKSLLEESRATLQQEEQPHLQMPQEETQGGAVEEKSLDGGIEEESNGRQWQREEEQMSARDEQVGGGSLHREAHEETHGGEGDERTEQQPEEERRIEGDERPEQHRTEERSNDQSQSEDAVSDAGGEAYHNQEEGSGGDDKPAVSEHRDDVEGNTSLDDRNIVESLPGEEDRVEVLATDTGDQNVWATQGDQYHQEK